MSTDPLVHQGETMGESHRARALRLAGNSASNADLAIVHALLAIEEQVQSLAYLIGHGADTRRLDCDDPTKVAER